MSLNWLTELLMTRQQAQLILSLACTGALAHWLDAISARARAVQAAMQPHAAALYATQGFSLLDTSSFTSLHCPYVRAPHAAG